SCLLVSCAALSFQQPIRAQEPVQDVSDDDPFGDAPTDAPAARPANPNPRGATTSVRPEADIRRSLDEATKIEVIETPLQEVLTYLQELHNVNIQLDQRAISDAGVDPDIGLSLNIKDVSLKSALRLLLRPLDLEYVIRDGVLMITSSDVAEATLELHAY